MSGHFIIDTVSARLITVLDNIRGVCITQKSGWRSSLVVPKSKAHILSLLIHHSLLHKKGLPALSPHHKGVVIIQKMANT